MGVTHWPCFIYIGLGTSAAGGALAAREIELNPACAHPAVYTRGVAVDERVIGYVARHHRSGSYKSIATNGVPADDGTVGAQRRADSNQRRLVFILAYYMATRVHNVSKHHGWAAEDIILENTVQIDGNVVLDLYVVTDRQIG